MTAPPPNASALRRHLARLGLAFGGAHAARADTPTLSITVAPTTPHPGTRSLTVRVSGDAVRRGDWRAVAADVRAQVSAALSGPR